jgi:phosphotransferase system  glucose/maltose/N-acetylglucosamine-specific IIC component|tara:strand:+ start:521 stop:715 length:195 start_codon:yes stop_codon:yes gene_type:complete
MTNESIYFEWLTFTWLMDNLVWICVGMIISMLILFIFPVLLGYSIKDEASKQQTNKTLKQEDSD